MNGMLSAAADRINTIASVEIAMAVLAFFGSMAETAAYGRFAPSDSNKNEKGKQGRLTTAWIMWMWMEAPMVFWMCYVAMTGPYAGSPGNRMMLLLFQLHYSQRTFVFPLLIRSKDKKNPVSIGVSAVVFNMINGLVQGIVVGWEKEYPASWFSQPCFAIGLFLYLAGYMINLQSDHITRQLRRPGESGYRIPHGGMFRYVSSPNYLGEMIEWIGWATMTWTLGGLAFALFTIANLAPRARSNHQWYLARFPTQYPALDRRALLPLLW